MKKSKNKSAMGRRAIKTNDDQDVHTNWYKVMCTYSRSRSRAKAKRRTRRRERMEAKRELKKELE